MRRSYIFSIALVALVGSAVGLWAAESEAFTGTATASGTRKRPQLFVGGECPELKASDEANASVTETLTKLFMGDIGTYVVTGTRSTVSGSIIVDATPPATAPPAAPASPAPDRRKYRSYDYMQGDYSLRLTVPEGLQVVRGILVVGPFSGGDTRDLHSEAWYREFMHLHDFAFLGAADFYLQDFKVFQNALKQFAADSKHAELVHAPYVATGFWAGGSFARRLLIAAPEKVIAAVIVGSSLKLSDVAPTAAHLGTPVCVINGEYEEKGMASLVEPVLADYRPKGALWGWVAVPGIGHERDAQEVLAMPMLDAAVRLRYPTDGDVRKGGGSRPSTPSPAGSPITGPGSAVWRSSRPPRISWALSPSRAGS